jgi:hypothetical protein
MLLALFLIASLSAHSAPACPAINEFREITEAFEFLAENDDTYAPLPPEQLCDPAGLPHKAALALLRLKKLPKLENAGPDFTRNFMQDTPYPFFQKRVAKIAFDSQGKSRGCKMVGTLAFVSGTAEKIMHLCPVAVNLSLLALQSNLVHEARHLKDPSRPTPGDELASYPHVLCDNGQAKGYDACEKEYDVGGSYSVQTEFLLQVARTGRLPKAYRNEARGMALSYVLDHFNKLPFPLEEGILLRDEAGEISFYSPEAGQLTSLAKGISPESLTSMRGVPVILDPADGSVRSYGGPGTFIKTPGSFAKFYREQAPGERAKILDVYFGGAQACLLYSTHLYCEIGDKSGEIRFPEGFGAKQLTVLNLFRDDIVFVATTGGDLHMIPLKPELEDFRFEKMDKNKTLTGFISVGMLQGRRNFGISPDGQLLEFKSAEEKAPVAALIGRKFRKILGSFRWSPKLNGL